MCSVDSPWCLSCTGACLQALPGNKTCASCGPCPARPQVEGLALHEFTCLLEDTTCTMTPEELITVATGCGTLEGFKQVRGGKM